MIRVTEERERSRWIGCSSEPHRYCREPLVGSPEFRVRSEQRRGEELGIDVANTSTVEFVPLDQGQNLRWAGDGCLGKVGEQTQDLAAAMKVAQREFAGDPGMAQNDALLEKFHENRVPGSEMVDPEGRVDQDQRSTYRRRGMSVTVGSLPPSLARRRALSLSIRAPSA